MDFKKKLAALFGIKSKPAEIKKDPLDKLKPFLQENGSYLLDLEITQDENHKITVKSANVSGFSVQQWGNSEPMEHINVCTITQGFEMAVSAQFQLNDVKIYFKNKETGIIVDGKDEMSGLAPGGSYQAILIPKTCAWRPNTILPQKSLKGSNFPPRPM